jgi:ubiquinone biosynthesis protein UbiJ
MLLELDQDAAIGLEELDGAVIAIEVPGPDLNFFICPRGRRLHVEIHSEEVPDVTIRGTPGDVLRYVSSRRQGGRKRGGSIEIIGDVATAQRLQGVLRNMRPDWEEAVSGWVGDGTARKLGNLVRSVSGYARSAAGSLGANVGEYLRYENRQLPDADEVQEFATAADTLRHDTERLRQRLELLQRRLRSAR